MRDDDASKKITSADKALETLMALGRLGMSHGGMVRLSDLVADLGFPRPTVHRLLNDLKAAGFAAQDHDSGRYKLGPRILLLSAQCLGGLDLRRVAQPIVADLVERTGLTAHLGVLDLDMIVYIDKFESLKGTRLSSSIGQRRRAVATALGKAILAFSGEDRIDALIGGGLVAATPKSITDPKLFRAELDRVHQRGWATDDEECEIGIRCGAAPIFDHTGQPIAAISASSIASQIDEAQLERLAQDVQTAALRVSAELGYAIGERAVTRYR